MGWGIQRELKGILLWHWGDNGAFKAFVMPCPARKSGIVIFAKPITDTAIDADALAFAWLN